MRGVRFHRMHSSKKWIGLEPPSIEKGSNFKCHSSIWINDDQLLIIPSWQSLFFFIFFIAFISVCSGGVLHHHFELDNYIYLLILAVSTLIVLPTVLMRSTVQIFNKRQGSYKRFCIGDALLGEKGLKRSYLLSNIFCIQVVEKCWLDSDNYEISGEELNLIFVNGSRVNILDQGDKKHTYELVKSISALVGKPYIEVRVNET